MAKTIWQEWLDGDSPHSDALWVSVHQVLWLEVPAGTSFSTVGHLPVLAGVNDLGEKEYLSSVVRNWSTGNPDNPDDVGGNVYCTVTEGASTATFINDDGQVMQSDHFWVLVLRFETSAEIQEELEQIGGVDITGQCHWARVQYTGNGDRIVAQLRGFDNVCLRLDGHTQAVRVK